MWCRGSGCIGPVWLPALVFLFVGDLPLQKKDLDRREEVGTIELGIELKCAVLYRAL